MCHAQDKLSQVHKIHYVTVFGNVCVISGTKSLLNVSVQATMNSLSDPLKNCILYMVTFH
jgi:hypothetical protein